MTCQKIIGSSSPQFPFLWLITPLFFAPFFPQYLSYQSRFLSSISILGFPITQPFFPSILFSPALSGARLANSNHKSLHLLNIIHTAHHHFFIIFTNIVIKFSEADVFYTVAVLGLKIGGVLPSLIFASKSSAAALS